MSTYQGNVYKTLADKQRAEAKQMHVRQTNAQNEQHVAISREETSIPNRRPVKKSIKAMSEMEKLVAGNELLQEMDTFEANQFLQALKDADALGLFLKTGPTFLLKNPGATNLSAEGIKRLYTHYLRAVGLADEREGPNVIEDYFEAKDDEPLQVNAGYEEEKKVFQPEVKAEVKDDRAMYRSPRVFSLGHPLAPEYKTPLRGLGLSADRPRLSNKRVAIMRGQVRAGNDNPTLRV